MKDVSTLAYMFLVCVMATACVDHSNGKGATHLQPSDEIQVCHGYSCKYQTKLSLGAPDARHIRAIMTSKRSPQEERAAIGRAVAYFDRRAFDAIGIRDAPRSELGAGGVRGQMDCIDESTNTRAFLRYLAGHQLLRHHKVQMNASRGLLVDGRYFHSTAVISDINGKEWAVDSWYSTTGGQPDMMPLDEWQADDSESRDARQ